MDQKALRPTIAKKFNTCRLPEAGCFADHKEKVMDLLAVANGERGASEGVEDDDRSSLTVMPPLGAGLDHRSPLSRL